MNDFFGFANNRQLGNRVVALSKYVREIIDAGNLVAHPLQRTAFQQAKRDYEIPEIIALENARSSYSIFPLAERRLARLSSLRGRLTIGQYTEWRPRARND